jgi:hypothetical protein
MFDLFGQLYRGGRWNNCLCVLCGGGAHQISVLIGDTSLFPYIFFFIGTLSDCNLERIFVIRTKWYCAMLFALLVNIIKFSDTNRCLTVGGNYGELERRRLKPYVLL